MLTVDGLATLVAASGGLRESALMMTAKSRFADKLASLQDNPAMSTGVRDWLEVSAALIGAIGTVAAIWLALFLQVTLVERRRPVLYLAFSDDRGEQDLSIIDLEDVVYFAYRPRVYAKASKETARNVEILLLRARRPENGVNQFHIPDRSFRWTGIGGRLADIPPGTWRRFDLLNYVVDRRDEVPRSALLAGIIPDSQETSPSDPIDRRWYLDDPGRYEFEVAVTADGMNAAGWRVTFDFSPGMFENTDLMRTHVGNIKYERMKIV
ncbi:hypothetical protein AB1484_12375 [Parafrankia sp. FMc6]|uniref:hypothetical protein n=1 Tax=Parafrankia soli TaxID=2599596 RepID=UPI0034D6B236